MDCKVAITLNQYKPAMVIESLLSNISSNSTGNSTWNDLKSNGSPNSTGNQPAQWEEPVFSKVFRFVIFGIIIFISLFGNALVIYVTYKNKTMRTFAYFLIANLAVADILSTLVLPFMIVYVDKYRWTFGETLCKILNPSLTVFSIVTTNTLVAIACDRSRALLFPFKLKPSTSETRLIIAIIWLLAVLVSLPSYGSRTVTNYQCVEIYTADMKKQKLYTQIYTVFTFLFNNFIPLVVILFLYIKITMALKHISLIPQSFQLNRQSSLVGRDSPGSSPRNSVVLRNANVAAANKRQRMESKFIRMLLIVVLVFLFCYVPYQVFFLLWEFLPDDPDNYDTASKFHLYLFVLMWIPNAINPICYAALNVRYARALKQLICKSFTKVKTFGTTIPSPRSTYTAGISRRKSSPVSV